MKEILLYQHGGSGNHGCEALVRTTVSLCREAMGEDTLATLCSNAVMEDRRYALDRKVKLTENKPVLRRKSPQWALYQVNRRLLHSRFLEDRFLTERLCLKAAKESDLAIAIGGDNYCYNKGIQFWPTDRRMQQQGCKTMLFGCSIEPEDLDAAFVRQLSLFDAITVRESISYEAMGAAGVPKEKLHLVPDPAFTLESKRRPLPGRFQPGNTVGINVSPMIIGNEQTAGVTMENYVALVRDILENTDCSVALIPHVVWSYNDDRVPLRRLYEQFADTGRVVLIGDADCRVLKGYIARLRLFVGARTHATIAAYSSGVPTLVVGYSVKARGIARDLFGTEENYVLPVQSLREESDLTRAFHWLLEHEEETRAQLQAILPDYIARAHEAGRIAAQLVESGKSNWDEC
ncbi:MAG: polysaccharide pyruvyl transferase family protein [Eubacteriales bacterium]|nr:polysaccharide pyruvyl transferase family protein [Eubacteriales bacterium]